MVFYTSKDTMEVVKVLTHKQSLPDRELWYQLEKGKKRWREVFVFLDIKVHKLINI